MQKLAFLHFSLMFYFVQFQYCVSVIVGSLYVDAPIVCESLSNPFLHEYSC